MVDPRDFHEIKLDPALEAQTGRLHLVGGDNAREDKRGSVRKRHGHIWLGGAGEGRPAYDVVVCDRESWALTLISDRLPPMDREVELAWEGEGGLLKRLYGKVTGSRHGRRTADPFPDLFFSRFESSLL